MSLKKPFCLINEKKYSFYEVFLYLCKDKNKHHGGKESIIHKSGNHSVCSGK